MQVLGKKYRFFQKKVPIVSKDTKKIYIFANIILQHEVTNYIHNKQ